MINIRYHIVSIVAVFLALAIGIAMGTTVIDKVTVDTLNDQLAEIEQQRTDAREHADALQNQVDALTQLQRDLAEQGTGVLLAGHLEAVPVVIVGVRGVDEGSVDELRAALVAAGAEYGGTLWLTDKLALTEESAVADLQTVLEISRADADLERSNLVNRLASALLEGATVPEPPVPEEPVPDPTAPTTETVPPDGELTFVPNAFLDALRASGFLDWDAPEDAAADTPSLPRESGRYVVVSGPGADVPDDDIVLPLLRALATADVAPVVAAQASTGSAAESVENRTAFVGPIRDDDTLRDRVATVDDLETFYGWAAVVLALESIGQSPVGHFGVGDGADRLLPVAVGTG